MTEPALSQLPVAERVRRLDELSSALVAAIRTGRYRESDLVGMVSRETGFYKDDIVLALARLDVIEDAAGHLRLA